MSDAASRSALGRPPASDLVWLAVAVAAVSTSAPIIVACTAPALAVAFWRCTLGAGALAPWVAWRRRRELAGLGGERLRLAVLAGALLGAHFAAWVPSLRFTSVASSTALVATQPVWAALIARARGVRVARQVWVGIGVSLLGAVVLTGLDFRLDPRAVLGDALALAGAVLAAAYVTVGGRVRQTVSTATYTVVAYGAAAALLLLTCLATGSALAGYGARDWALILALTAGAQLVGHTLINRVLATTSATVVSLGILFEMPGAVLVAAVWLRQVPSASVLPAVLLLFVGLALVIRAGDAAEPTESPPA